MYPKLILHYRVAAIQVYHYTADNKAVYRHPTNLPRLRPTSSRIHYMPLKSMVSSYIHVMAMASLKSLPVTYPPTDIRSKNGGLGSIIFDTQNPTMTVLWHSEMMRYKIHSAENPFKEQKRVCRSLRTASAFCKATYAKTISRRCGMPSV